MCSNRTNQLRSVLSVLIATAVSGGSALAADLPLTPSTAAGVSVTVVASGLHDPRGLAIGPGNQIYVAEAGTTVGPFVPPPPPPHNEPPTRTRCEMYWPVGPKLPGHTGGVSRIDRHGGVHVVTDGMPSSAANRLIGGDRFGPAAVGFRGQRLYVMESGGGCAEGHPSEPNGLYQVFSDGSYVPRIDLSAYLRSNDNSKSPLDEDFEPDGTWYNLLRAFGAFYALEPNQGVLLRLDDDGSASLFFDVLGAVAELEGDGDQTWTALTRHGSVFYVGSLGRIDLDFDAAIYRINRDGTQIERVASGLHGVVGVAFDRSDRMYVLETTASGVFPPLADPTVGRLVRVERNGSLTPLVTGLTFPTALMAGRDGAFYVSNCGYHCDDETTGESLGVGQILRISIAGAEAESLH